MTQPLPARDSGDGRRTPRCICRTSNGVHAQGCALARPLPPVGRGPIQAYLAAAEFEREVAVQMAFLAVCRCGLARTPYRIGRTDGLICPVCDRA